MSLEFQHPEYRGFFEGMLCRDGEVLELYADLFDLGPVPAKRSAFVRIRGARLNELIGRFGIVCMLGLAPDCDVASGLCLDHLIPLSSNKLNKELLSATTFRDANGNFRIFIEQEPFHRFVDHGSFFCGLFGGFLGGFKAFGFAIIIVQCRLRLDRHNLCNARVPNAVDRIARSLLKVINRLIVAEHYA